MDRKIGTGLVAGLIAGVVFTLVALFLKTTMPDGEQTSMLIVAAEALHSHGGVAGLIASLIYTVILGGIFGWLVKAEPPNEPRLMVWGGLYGLAWWLVSALIVLPALLAKMPLSSAAVDAMRPVALASLIEHLLYGVILGFVYALLTTYVDRRHGTHAVTHHAA
jgi:Na+(H+)/acetate symporter ActP